ncbi:hypothetical protein Dimus_012288 [Dionaea muscipula]
MAKRGRPRQIPIPVVVKTPLVEKKLDVGTPTTVKSLGRIAETSSLGFREEIDGAPGLIDVDNGFQEDVVINHVAPQTKPFLQAVQQGLVAELKDGEDTLNAISASRHDSGKRVAPMVPMAGVSVASSVENGGRDGSNQWQMAGVPVASSMGNGGKDGSNQWQTVGRRSNRNSPRGDHRASSSCLLPLCFPNRYESLIGSDALLV